MKNVVDKNIPKIKQIAKYHNFRTMYNIKKNVFGFYECIIESILSKKKHLNRKEESLKRWVEYFIFVSNQESTTDAVVVKEISKDLYLKN